MKTTVEMETILLQMPCKRGPIVRVVKMTMVPTAPSIMNTVHHACEIWMTGVLPVPDKIRAMLVAERS